MPYNSVAKQKTDFAKGLLLASTLGLNISSWSRAFQMPLEWEKTAMTKAPPSKAIEFYMNPEVHVAKTHPDLVKQLKILSKEGDKVTWEQSFSFLRMNLRTVVQSSLNRENNTIETQSIDGTGKGTRMIRTFKAIPTGTQAHYIFTPKLGPFGFFLKRRAKKGFEETVNQDIKALDGLA